MVVQSNISALFASNSLQKTTGKWAKSTEKLSSGYKINRAADDAAGLSISEKMRWQIRGLNRAAQNIEDGMSYCNVADGALNEVHSMLDRIKELSVQAASDVNTDDDRKAIDSEVQQLKDQMTDIFRNTTFNSMKIWQAAYVPDVGGEAGDFSFYNVSDGTGTYVGGITYMNHRYSWADLGMGGNWNATTHTFNSDGDYNVSLPAVNGNTASFKLKTTAGCTGNEVQKTYGWSADATGIKIDGVSVNGTPPEAGNTTWAAMGITSGAAVAGGTYSFNYYGMDISFDVPAGGADWTDFVDNFNNPRMALNWHSDYGSSSSQETAVMSNISNKIVINNANAAYISTSANPYTVKADQDGIWIVNDASAATALTKSPDTFVAWQDLAARYAVGGGSAPKLESWGMDATNDQTSPSDKNDGTHSTSQSNNNGGAAGAPVDKDTLYKYAMNTLFSDGTNKFGFDISMFENTSRDGVVSDIDNTAYTNLGITSPTTITATGTRPITATGTLSITASGSNFSFETQRDQLGRTFASNNDLIVQTLAGSGATVNGSDLYELRLGSGGSSYSLTSDKTSTQLTQAMSDKMVEEMKRIATLSMSDADKLEQMLNLGTYSLHMGNGSDGFDISIDLGSIKYKDISGAVITDDSTGAITTAVSDFDIASKVNSLLKDNATFELKGNGPSYQDVGIVQNYRVEQDSFNVAMLEGFDLSLKVQVGAMEGQDIDITYDYLRLGNIGMKGASVLSREGANRTITLTDRAIDIISGQRTLFGAYTNRLSHSYSANKNTAENTQSAESRIRDTDIAAEMVEYSKNNILVQAGQAMLAQANSQNQNIAQLFQ